MNLTLKKVELQEYVLKQIDTFYPDKYSNKNLLNIQLIDKALERLDYCFNKITFSYYNDGEKTKFNHLFSDQYLMFIWFLSNTVFNEYGINNLTNKLYYLNKTLHGFDCMADTNLPDIFLVQHGVGTMLGKAKYSNYLVVYQGCTVGSNKGKYPILEQGVTLAANSSIIGSCIVGMGTTVSTRTLLFEKNTQNNSIIFPNSTRISKTPFSQSFFNENVLLS